MNRRFNVTSEILNAGYKTGNLLKYLDGAFENEISNMRAENPIFKDLSTAKLFLLDAGIKNSSSTTFMTESENEWLYPAYLSSVIEERLFMNGISPLSYLFNTTVMVDGGKTVKTLIIDVKDDAQNVDAARMKRVAEGADLPLAVIRTSEKEITIFKTGRAIEITYEAMRQANLDLINKKMGYLINDSAQTQVEYAVNTLITGDGNSNGITTLFTAPTSNLTTKQLLTAIMNYLDNGGGTINTIVCNANLFIKFLDFGFDNKLVPGINTKFLFDVPQFDTKTIKLIYSPFVPETENGEDQAILMNIDDALVRYVESNSFIKEETTQPRNQVKLYTVSVNAGFGIGRYNARGRLIIPRGSDSISNGTKPPKV